MADCGLRQIFSKHLPEAHWQAIETWSTGSGVPDAEYCFPKGLQGWVEFKMTKANKVIISPHQVAWAERRTRMGGRVSLAVRRRSLQGPRREARDELFIYEGRDTRAVLDHGLDVLPQGSWGGGPAHWDWRRIRDLLTRPLNPPDKERKLD